MTALVLESIIALVTYAGARPLGNPQVLRQSKFPGMAVNGLTMMTYCGSYMNRVKGCPGKTMECLQKKCTAPFAAAAWHGHMWRQRVS